MHRDPVDLQGGSIGSRSKNVNPVTPLLDRLQTVRSQDPDPIGTSNLPERVDVDSLVPELHAFSDDKNLLSGPSQVEENRNPSPPLPHTIEQGQGILRGEEDRFTGHRTP